ncbi:hypothetical protein PIB30_033014 [Stylosanthes scabra]|uniref:Uncharacterized protein n=1 Tax=Stylosanthes scabra TaxID=79078 RepID=A0ABU6VB47_9FABA|nr:hypothetical protein [Stylosanthes scabra]
MFLLEDEDESDKRRDYYGFSARSVGDDGVAAINGAEDGAVATENVVDAKAEPFLHFSEEDEATDLNCGGDADDVDDGTESSVEVGASTKEAENSVSGSAGNGAVVRVTDGGLLKRGLRRFVFQEMESWW